MVVGLIAGQLVGMGEPPDPWKNAQVRDTKYESLADRQT